jgi:hypothetical protein
MPMVEFKWLSATLGSSMMNLSQIVEHRGISVRIYFERPTQPGPQDELTPIPKGILALPG